MQVLHNIKAYYRPIQPAISADHDSILYREISPDQKIDHFIYCFWQLKTKIPLDSPFVYRVVSDGCIDIFFNHLLPTESFIMGFCRKYTEFPIGQHFDYIGIRFLPAAFPLLFGINAKMLSNQCPPLEQVIPSLSAWIKSTITAETSFESICWLLNQKLTEQIEQQTLSVDLRFIKALNLIFKYNGYLNTETDLDTGLSPRQLRRIFNFYIGTTAKTFSNVTRFQYILNAKPSKASKIYFDVGFFDQAHFIKQFKTFYGVSPSKAFL